MDEATIVNSWTDTLILRQMKLDFCVTDVPRLSSWVGDEHHAGQTHADFLSSQRMQQDD